MKYEVTIIFMDGPFIELVEADDPISAAKSALISFCKDSENNNINIYKYGEPYAIEAYEVGTRNYVKYDSHIKVKICFSCDKREQKYITGLCESCNDSINH